MSGQSLLVALGHRAVARKCEQVASRPDVFTPTRPAPPVRRSSLEREMSPDSALGIATALASSQTPDRPAPVEHVHDGGGAAPACLVAAADKEKARAAGREVPVLLLSTPGAGAEETVSRPGLSSLWGDGVGSERAEETDPEEEDDDDTCSTSSSDEYDGSVTDQEEYDDRSGRVCPLSPREAAHEDEVALADRILAQHYIMERPDLQRFDSADAALQAWHRKEEEEAAAGQEEEDEQSERGATSRSPTMRLPLALDTPPPSVYSSFDGHTDTEGTTPVSTPCLLGASRAIEGFTDISLDSPIPSPVPRWVQQETGMERQDSHVSTASEEEVGGEEGELLEEEEEEEEEEEVVRCSRSGGHEGHVQPCSGAAYPSKPPSLKHFDSADYNMDKHKKRGNKAARHGSGSSRGSSLSPAPGATGDAPLHPPPQQQQPVTSSLAGPPVPDGHKMVANFLINRGETRTRLV